MAFLDALPDHCSNHDVEPLSKHKAHHPVGEEERPEHDAYQRVLASVGKHIVETFGLLRGHESAAEVSGWELLSSRWRRPGRSTTPESQSARPSAE